MQFQSVVFRCCCLFISSQMFGFRLYSQGLVAQAFTPVRHMARTLYRPPLTRSSAWLEGLFGKKLVDVEVDPGEVKGTKLRILKYPHPKLRQENEDIVDFNDDLKVLAEEMLLVMYAADGIGLAAPQLGINKRLMVFNGIGGSMTERKGDVVLVNPVIIARSTEEDLKEEGCLSFPLIYGHVKRSKWIDVSYQDIRGTKLGKKFEGLEARVFQHEFDHLDKVLFIDRLEETDKKLNQKRLDKYVKKYGPGAAA